MKKLLFGLIATVMFGNLSFGQEEIKLTDYGKYHNELLSLYFSKYSIADEESTDTFFDNLMGLTKEKYPGKFDKVDVNELKSIFGRQKIINVDLTQIWNIRKKELENEKLLSPMIIQFADDIVEGKYSTSQVQEMILKLKNSKSISENDKNALIVLNSVLTDSQRYWASTSSDSNHSYGKWKISERELADALGAFVWCYSGPMCVIMGVACSGFF